MGFPFFGINRFHICALLTWQIAIFFAGQNVFGIFANYSPRWSCGNSTFGKNCAILEKCPKEQLKYAENEFQSAAMDFEWICGSKSFYGRLFTQIQFVGVLLGTVTFGFISDSIGRKPTGILVLSMAIIATIVNGLSPSDHFLLATRFFVGLATGGILVVICTWCMEVIEPNQRMVLRGVFNWGWTRIALTIIAYFCREWRLSLLVCAGCVVPALLLVIFVIPESPTWLHSKNKKQEMIESEQKIAKVAGIEYIPLVHKQTEPKSILETIRAEGNLKKLIVLWIMWFIASICGFANDLNSNNLSGDFYLNQILFGILLVVSKWVLLAVDQTFDNFKRRTLHQGAQAISILIFIVLTIFTFIDYGGIAFLILYLLGTVFIEYTWDACYLCAIESMETPCRSSAAGTCSFVARIGGICAPFLNHLNTLWPGAVFITVVVLGTFNLIISYLFLEETKNKKLDEIDDEQDETIVVVREPPKCSN
ncbi:unnamed protein product [Caenorhabditis bovis]|uniref:Major facilitator superfamily (MFS) profile domain-containing protein n=1 Tax=Caenorhabditis bovis TaxID=2654633 RepID=A0A8S1F808_9PELO|nr:unnamed protein product [Caenorhabditis bovis]